MAIVAVEYKDKSICYTIINLFEERVIENWKEESSIRLFTGKENPLAYHKRVDFCYEAILN